MKGYVFGALILACVFFGYYITKKFSIQKPKIVGLIAARNEEAFVGQCLKCLSLYTDAIIFLNDASTDSTLSIVESLKDECNIAKIINKEVWKRDETGDRNLLLNAGREIGGTHFIVIDADEIITAPCLKDNYLRNRILELKPGDYLWMHWVQTWRTPYMYRDDSSVWSGQMKDFVFCDDGKCKYGSAYFLHATRCPWMTTGQVHHLEDINKSILHFQFANWRNLLIKQAWYRCLERIRLPEKRVNEINELYAPTKNEVDMHLSPVDCDWIAYDFFDTSVFFKPEVWREKQITGWFKEYGIDYFKELDIWDIDWRFS